MHAALFDRQGGARGRASKSAGPVHKQAHWRVRTRTAARLHTPLAPKTHQRRPVQGLGFAICVYFILPQGSDTTMPSVQAYLRV